MTEGLKLKCKVFSATGPERDGGYGEIGLVCMANEDLENTVLDYFVVKEVIKIVLRPIPTTDIEVMLYPAPAAPLRPCPLCGGKAVIVPRCCGLTSHPVRKIECTKCHASTIWYNENESDIATAIRHWNDLPCLNRGDE